MAKDTPSMAKNKIRRSLAAIMDPHPGARDAERLWQYFQSSCAYCGQAIERASRTGHLDHVLAAAHGGGNSIHNHVLSCARCNGDEKREMPWDAFLAAKCSDPLVAQLRSERIAAWLAQAPASTRTVSTAAQFESVVSKAVASYEAAVEKVRELRKSGT